ncbi:substrate binding domain-containing protein [Paraburkholderia xenovorans]|uniref:substrate binding domain-containing protein n=1 Tax=Paraburkholderia xenovorans TaxID=36873 RepID=UPI0038BA7E48
MHGHTSTHARPCGKLRVRTPVGFGQHYLIKAIGAYQQLYPEVKVRLTLANGTPDFIEDGCDVAIVGALALSDSQLISQKIGSAFSIVCASRTYIETHGVPHKPDDLEAHSCIHLNTPESPMNVWSFAGPNGEESISADCATANLRGFYPNTVRRKWDFTRCIYRDNTWTQRFAAGWTI